MKKLFGIKISLLIFTVALLIVSLSFIFLSLLISPSKTEAQTGCWGIAGSCDSGCQSSSTSSVTRYTGDGACSATLSCPSDTSYTFSGACSTDGSGNCYKRGSSRTRYTSCSKGSACAGFCSGSYNCSGLGQSTCQSLSQCNCSWAPTGGTCSGTITCLVFESQSECQACGCTWDVGLGWCKGTRSCSSGWSESQCANCGCTWTPGASACSGSYNCTGKPQSSCYSECGCSWTDNKWIWNASGATTVYSSSTTCEWIPSFEECPPGSGGIPYSLPCYSNRCHYTFWLLSNPCVQDSTCLYRSSYDCRDAGGWFNDGAPYSCGRSEEGIDTPSGKLTCTCQDQFYLEEPQCYGNPGSAYCGAAEPTGLVRTVVYDCSCVKDSYGANCCTDADCPAVCIGDHAFYLYCDTSTYTCGTSSANYCSQQNGSGDPSPDPYYDYYGPNYCYYDFLVHDFHDYSCVSGQGCVEEVITAAEDVMDGVFDYTLVEDCPSQTYDYEYCSNPDPETGNDCERWVQTIDGICDESLPGGPGCRYEDIGDQTKNPLEDCCAETGWYDSDWHGPYINRPTGPCCEDLQNCTCYDAHFLEWYCDSEAGTSWCYSEETITDLGSSSCVCAVGGKDSLDCGAVCDSTHGCPSNSCSVNYTDQGCVANNQFKEYNQQLNCGINTINVSDSCYNSCQDTCLCTNCSVSCPAPSTTTHCCVGVCGAVCAPGDPPQTCTATCTYNVCAGVNDCQPTGSAQVSGTQTCGANCTWGTCVPDTPCSSLNECTVNAHCLGCSGTDTSCGTTVCENCNALDTCVGTTFQDWYCIDNPTGCGHIDTTNAPECEVSVSIKIRDFSGCYVTDPASPCYKSWLKADTYTFEFKAEGPAANLSSYYYHIIESATGNVADTANGSLSGTTDTVTTTLEAGPGKPLHLEGAGVYLVYFEAKNIYGNDTLKSVSLGLNFDFTPPGVEFP